MTATPRTAQFVVIRGETGHQDTELRTEYFIETLLDHSIPLEKLHEDTGLWSREKGYEVMKSFISRSGDAIEAVFANNDDMAAGAVDAYDELNYTEDNRPVFFGVDGTSVGLQAVKDGDFAGTVYNDKSGQAEAMAKLASALVTGEGMDELEFKNGKYIYVPYSKVTRENVGEYIGRE